MTLSSLDVGSCPMPSRIQPATAATSSRPAAACFVPSRRGSD